MRPAPPVDAPYEAHRDWAVRAPVQGFDFTPVAGRVVESPLPWDYLAMAREHTADGPVLDLGTGGGELYASLAPLPPGSAATEGWEPNVVVARGRLEPLGVEVRSTVADPLTLPFQDASFHLVLDRHEEYAPEEVRRVLTEGGVFLTQQVGSDDGTGLNEALGGPSPDVPDGVTLAPFVADLERAGLTVELAREHVATRTFHDVGALIWYLLMIPWQVPGFDVDAYDAPLRRLHERMAAGTPFTDRAPRFVIRARR